MRTQALIGACQNQQMPPKQVVRQLISMLGPAVLVVAGLLVALLSRGRFVWLGGVLVVLGALYGVSIAIGPRARRGRMNQALQGDVERSVDKAGSFDDPY